MIFFLLSAFYTGIIRLLKLNTSDLWVEFGKGNLNVLLKYCFLLLMLPEDFIFPLPHSVNYRADWCSYENCSTFGVLFRNLYNSKQYFQ